MHRADSHFATLTIGLDTFKNASDFPPGLPYYKRSDAGRTMGIFVPASNAVLDRLGIAPGSGIVGSPASQGEVIVLHYEGNLHEAVNMRSWRDRVIHAAGRHATGYPTCAWCSVSGADLDGLIRVGVIHGDYTLEIDPECVDIVREYAERYQSTSAGAAH